jgi:hypothetical protein
MSRAKQSENPAKQPDGETENANWVLEALLDIL